MLNIKSCFGLKGIVFFAITGVLLSPLLFAQTEFFWEDIEERAGERMLWAYLDLSDSERLYNALDISPLERFNDFGRLINQKLFETDDSTVDIICDRITSEDRPSRVRYSHECSVNIYFGHPYPSPSTRLEQRFDRGGEEWIAHLTPSDSVQLYEILALVGYSPRMESGATKQFSDSSHDVSVSCTTWDEPMAPTEDNTFCDVFIRLGD